MHIELQNTKPTVYWLYCDKNTPDIWEHWSRNVENIRLWLVFSTFLLCSQNACLFYHILLYKYQWNTKWAFPRKLHIFTREDIMLSSYVKRSPSSWLHNKSPLWKQADLVFHWCLYNKQNITYSLMDMNFILHVMHGLSFFICWINPNTAISYWRVDSSGTN